MSNPIIVKETAPHIRRKATVARMMLDVIIALVPVIVFSFVAWGLRALMIIGISLVAWIGSEAVYVGIRNQFPKSTDKHTFKEKIKHAYSAYTINNLLGPIVSALIFSMAMPAGASWYHVLIGSLFGSILGKLVFGGLGSNIFNPAVVGMCSAKLMFGGSYLTINNSLLPDAFSSATPLQADLGTYSMLDLFLGKTNGTLGEVSALCIIIGLVYLLIRRSADFRVTFSYLGTFLFYILIAGIFYSKAGYDYGTFVGTQMLSGGLLFGATFMLTDPVTSPINKPNRILYGMIAATFTVIIRLFGGLPEGVGFSILLSNMLVPVLDYYKWSTPKFTKKFWIIGSILLVIGLLVVCLALGIGGVK